MVAASQQVVKVTLEWFEVSRAAGIGVTRHIESRKRGFYRPSWKGADWDVDITGALGECAFAKAANLYWAGGVNTFRLPDVGKIQVRWRSQPSLAVKHTDADDEVFVLVTGGPQEFTIHGWLLGKEAKVDSYRKDLGHGEAFFVPQESLRPVSELFSKEG